MRIYEVIEPKDNFSFKMDCILKWCMLKTKLRGFLSIGKEKPIKPIFPNMLKPRRPEAHPGIKLKELNPLAYYSMRESLRNSSGLEVVTQTKDDSKNSTPNENWIKGNLTLAEEK